MRYFDKFNFKTFVSVPTLFVSALTSGCIEPRQNDAAIVDDVGSEDRQLATECVNGVMYTDDPQIVPNPSPFMFCPVDPNSELPNGTPNNSRYGSIVLKNCGHRTLEIASSSLTNQGADVFTQLALASTSIGAGGEGSIRFLYTSMDLLEHHGLISISSNAINYSVLEIEIVVVANGAVSQSLCPLVGVDAGFLDR